MRIGPKYKIARRLGAPVFEKTQTHKFVQSQQRKDKSGRSFSRPKSDFGLQLIEKQKARYTYGISEKQFAKYVKSSLAKKSSNAVTELYETLELRADNIAYRSGFATTRQGARQLVSHGHMMVNAKRITIPSMRLSLGDVVSIRPASARKPLFASYEERASKFTSVPWLKVDAGKKEAKIDGNPKFDAGNSLFDINAILEFYSR
jgi:small subunit ribosomal protein S4